MMFNGDEFLNTNPFISWGAIVMDVWRVDGEDEVSG